MNHEERRWLLHAAVEHLEPDAHGAAVREHVRRRHGQDLPLVRIYVDLERLVSSGYLSRERRAAPAGEGTAFHWETTGKVLVEPDRPDPRALAAAAPLTFASRRLPDAVPLAASPADFAR